MCATAPTVHVHKIPHRLKKCGPASVGADFVPGQNLLVDSVPHGRNPLAEIGPPPPSWYIGDAPPF